MSCSLLKTKMKLFTLLLSLSVTKVKVYPTTTAQASGGTRRFGRAENPPVKTWWSGSAIILGRPVGLTRTHLRKHAMNSGGPAQPTKTMLCG